MEAEKFINLFMIISEKANTLSGNYDSDEFEAEILHTSFALALRELTEKQYSSIPLLYRTTIEKVENKILKYVSEEYKNDYEQLVRDGGKFRQPKDKKKINPIGFIVE